MYLEISPTCIFFVYSYEANLAALLLKQKGLLNQKYHYLSMIWPSLIFTCSQKKEILIQAKPIFWLKRSKIKSNLEEPQSSASHYDIHTKVIVKKDAHLCNGDLKHLQVTGAKTKWVISLQQFKGKKINSLH